MTSETCGNGKRTHLDLMQKWLVTQHWAKQHPPLTRAGLAVLLRLLDRQNTKTGRCDPSAAGLADDTGFSVRSIRNAFTELEGRGAIKRFRKTGRARNQFLIFSVEELGQQTRLAGLKPRAGRTMTRNCASGPHEGDFRPTVKRSSPETRKETKKKKDGAERGNALGSARGTTNKPFGADQMDLGGFEARVAKVFEKEGYGYAGLLMLQAGDLEEAYMQLAAGDLSFSGAVGRLLEKYRALKEGV